MASCLPPVNSWPTGRQIIIDIKLNYPVPEHLPKGGRGVCGNEGIQHTVYITVEYYLSCATHVHDKNGHFTQ